jgi:hypothetical protein
MMVTCKVFVGNVSDLVFILFYYIYNVSTLEGLNLNSEVRFWCLLNLVWYSSELRLSQVFLSNIFEKWDRVHTDMKRSITYDL